jgi:hypothetical protein
MGVGAGGFLKGDISEKNTAEMGRWAIFRIRSNDRPVLGTAFGRILNSIREVLSEIGSSCTGRGAGCSGGGVFWP